MPIPARPDEVAWSCQQCGQGLYLDEVKGLLPQEINFSATIPQGAIGKPYWVADGKVTLRRVTFGSSRDQEAAQRFWSQPRRFFVPAYQASLENLLGQAAILLHSSPPLQPGPVARFEAITRPKEEIHAAAEFIVVAIEARRNDRLKEIQVSIELSPPALWVLEG
jgi:hypothetical protein